MQVKSRLQYQTQKLRNKVAHPMDAHAHAHAQETVIDFCLSAAAKQRATRLLAQYAAQ